MSKIKYDARPFVKNAPHWDCLNWTSDKLKSLLGSYKMQVRTARSSGEIQNEHECETLSGTVEDFLKLKTVWYCAYMRLCELYETTELGPIPWDEIGLNDSGGDACLWVGSEGSRTKLHQDTYGWNCIIQIQGRKLWKLLPPDENVFATRVPFEESTIWGLCKNISREFDSVVEICLKPGEMLIVPPGWWHQVESLDLSVSVNIWNPNEPRDSEHRTKEAMTRIMANICRQSNISVPTLDDDFGDLERLVNFLPKNSENTIEGKYRLFHALTSPSVIDAILTAYKNA